MKRPEISVAELDARARSIRKTVLRMCRARGGYAGQGVALAELAACVYFSELRRDASPANSTTDTCCPTGTMPWSHTRHCLSTSLSDYVTGQVIAVDGGMCRGPN